MSDDPRPAARDREQRLAPPLVAVCLHAAVVAMFYAMGPQAGSAEPRRPRESSPAPVEIDLGLVEAAPPPAPLDARGEASRLSPTSPLVSTSARGATLADGVVRSPAPDHAVDETAGVGRMLPTSTGFDERARGENEAEKEGRTAGATPVVVTQPRITDLGIGLRETNRFLPTNAEVVETAERRRAIDHALKDPARAKEQALGLGPEGPVLTALADGTSRSTAPVRGRAVFVATTDATGLVTSIELREAEGGRSGWDDARKLALTGLRGKKLRMPLGSTRAVMKIEVVSAWKLPSGQDPGADITLFGVPIAKGEGKDSAKVTLLDPIPKARLDVLELAPGVKIPVVSFIFDILNMNPDPTNLGAKPQRVIHTRAIETTAM